MIALTHGASVIDNPSVATALAGIHGVIDRTITNPFVLHRFHELEDNRHILLGFPISLYIADVSTKCNGMEGGFTADLLKHTDLLLHIHVEGVHIVVEVIYPWDNTVSLPIHTGETP